MQRSILQHFTASLTALTVISSALMAAPDEQAVQAAHKVEKQAKKFFTNHRRNALYLVGAGALVAGAYAAYKYWHTPQKKTITLADAPLPGKEQRVLDTVSALLASGKRFAEPEQYPLHLAELYNIMLNTLGTTDENRIELAREIQGLFSALAKNFAAYVVRHPQVAAPEAMRSVRATINTNDNGFTQIPSERTALMCCSFSEPAHVIVGTRGQRDEIIQLLHNCANTLTGDTV